VAAVSTARRDTDIFGRHTHSFDSTRLRSAVMPQRLWIASPFFARRSLCVSVVAGLVAISSTEARSQIPRSGRPLQIEDYYAVRTLGAPEMAPVGRCVAYTGSTRVE